MEKNIIRMITVLYRKSQSCLSVILSRHNISTAEMPFLMILSKSDGAYQEELAAMANTDKAAAARSVKSLDDKGFVTRIQDETDRRQNRVYLTQAARDLLPAIHEEILSFSRLLTESIDEKSLDSVFSALAKMEENAVRLSADKKTINHQEVSGSGKYR